jgi:hypothetical protein
MSLLGPDALLTGDDSPMSGLLVEILVSVPASSIAGGTDEIQRNILPRALVLSYRGRPGYRRYNSRPEGAGGCRG